MELAQTPTIYLLTGAHTISAFLTTLSDYLVAPLYKRLLLTIFYLSQASSALQVGDSSKSFAVISVSAVLIALCVSGSDTFSVFFGVRLALKHVLMPAVSSIDYRVTSAESQVDVVFGPIPFVFYVGTCALLRSVGRTQYLVLHFGLYVVAAVMAHWLVTSMVVKGIGWNQMRVDLRCGLKAVLDFAAWVIGRVPDALAAFLRATSDLFNQWDASQIDHEKSTADGGKIYEYQSLNPVSAIPVSKIRLLRVLRRKLGTELQCKLEHFDLDKAPPYEAISYAWGSQKLTEKLLVDGCSLMVTPRAKEIVGYFHSFIGPRYLWIDGVCINQDDKIEKGQQVAIMGKIYQRAYRVVVWLGPPGEVKDAYEARRLLCFLAYNWRHGGYDSLEYLRMLSKQRDLRWPAIETLFAHPWFSRAWVVQEMALPRTLHVIYGEICLDWDSIAATIQIIRDPFIVCITHPEGALGTDFSRSSRLVQLSNIQRMAWIRKQVQEGKTLSLGRVLGACMEFKVTHAPDKIFSILGIIVDGAHPDLAPNYTKPIVEVYVDVMRHILFRGNNEDIDFAIQFAGIGSPRSLGMQNLPTWVPDWGCTPAGKVRRKPYSISKGPEGAVSFTLADAEHLLEIRGVEIDRVRDLGAVCGQGGIEPLEDNMDLENVMNNLFSWMQEAHAMAQAYSRHLYSSEEAVQEALWQALKAPNGAPESEDNSTAQLALMWQQLERFMNGSAECPSIESSRGREFLIEIRPIFAVIGLAFGKRFCVTKEGRMTLVPPNVEKGNLICHMRGLQMPIVLRKKQRDEGKAVEHYELLGHCILDANVEMMGSAVGKWYTIA